MIYSKRTDMAKSDCQLTFLCQLCAERFQLFKVIVRRRFIGGITLIADQLRTH